MNPTSAPADPRPRKALVTDNTAWQPPTTPGQAQVPAPESPFSATPLAPGTAGAPQPGWTPPPRPGLIPLRPLTLGTLLGAAFQVLRRNPRPTFGFGLVVMSFVAVLTFLSVGLVTVFGVSRTLNATGADAETLAAGSVALSVVAGLVAVGFSLVAAALLQGIISLEVARATLGEKLTLGGLFRAARGRLWPLIGWSLLVATAIVVAIGVIVLLIAVLGVLGGTAGAVGAVLLGLAAGAGGLVVAFWLGTRLSLVPSVLMLERLTLRAALSRSWSLTRGFFWKTLGVQLLVNVIVQVVTSIISTPISFLGGLGAGLLDPTGDPTAAIPILVVVYLVTLLVTIVFGAISAVVQSATPALLYIDLRMRKEGLDLELTQFVEARQSGDRNVADPYLPRPAAAVPLSATSMSPWS